MAGEEQRGAGSVPPGDAGPDILQPVVSEGSSANPEASRPYYPAGFFGFGNGINLRFDEGKAIPAHNEFAPPYAGGAAAIANDPAVPSDAAQRGSDASNDVAPALGGDSTAADKSATARLPEPPAAEPREGGRSASPPTAPVVKQEPIAPERVASANTAPLSESSAGECGASDSGGAGQLASALEGSVGVTADSYAVHDDGIGGLDPTMVGVNAVMDGSPAIAHSVGHGVRQQQHGRRMHSANGSRYGGGAYGAPMQLQQQQQQQQQLYGGGGGGSNSMSPVPASKQLKQQQQLPQQQHQQLQPDMRAAYAAYGAMSPAVDPFFSSVAGTDASLSQMGVPIAMMPQQHGSMGNLRGRPNGAGTSSVSAGSGASGTAAAGAGTSGANMMYNGMNAAQQMYANQMYGSYVPAMHMPPYVATSPPQPQSQAAAAAAYSQQASGYGALGQQSYMAANGMVHVGMMQQVAPMMGMHMMPGSGAASGYYMPDMTGYAVTGSSTGAPAGGMGSARMLMHAHSNGRGQGAYAGREDHRHGGGGHMQRHSGPPGRGDDKRDRRKKGGGTGPGAQDRLSELVAATSKLTLESVRGSVHRMSKDQVGCRMLQTKLDEGDPATATMIFDEAKPHLLEMMVDPFGNYLFQKILERITEEQRTEVAELVTARLVDAGRNLHGTRSVQKMIELAAATPVQATIITAALAPAAADLCTDANGNHVIQRVLQSMRPADNQFVFDALLSNCEHIATHRHGCCVVQRALDAATTQQRHDLVQEVAVHALVLMQDPYGNYVVQYVLDISTAEDAASLVRAPLGRVATLSMQKFSSNVIEKCLERASEEVRVQYLHELGESVAMPRLLHDQFANYVIQRALTIAPQAAALQLVEAVRPHLAAMRNTSGGRRIATKILKRFPMTDLGPIGMGMGMPPMQGGGGGGMGGGGGGGMGGGGGGMMVPGGGRGPPQQAVVGGWA